MKGSLKFFLFLFLTLFLFVENPFRNLSLAWDCETHTYIAKKAGLKNPEYACLPDIVREEYYSFFVSFHYHSLPPQEVIKSFEYIDRFKVEEKLVDMNGKKIKILVPHPSGTIYWKIVDLYEKMQKLNKEGSLENKVKYDYYLYSIAHFIGDLSNPLHNFPFYGKPAGDGNFYPEEGKFNKENHEKFDKAFTLYYHLNPKEVEQKINSKIEVIKINSVEDLKREILKIANSAKEIALRCFKENRIPTQEEVLKQVSFSISLLKSLYNSTSTY